MLTGNKRTVCVCLSVCVRGGGGVCVCVGGITDRLRESNESISEGKDWGGWGRGSEKKADEEERWGERGGEIKGRRTGGEIKGGGGEGGEEAQHAGGGLNGGCGERRSREEMMERWAGGEERKDGRGQGRGREPICWAQVFRWLCHVSKTTDYLISRLLWEAWSGSESVAWLAFSCRFFFFFFAAAAPFSRLRRGRVWCRYAIHLSVRARRRAF